MLSLSFLIIFLNCLAIYFARSMEDDVNILKHYVSDLTVDSDLEQQFKAKLAQKKKIEEKLRKLNEQIAKDTEYFEEIPHFAVKSFQRIRSKKSSIENAFKNIIGMVGVKYTYKRDADWRTWREVRYPKNKQEIICYRCQNIVNFNETKCHQGGHWVIEENQPQCSYEILSFKNKDELCIAHFWQLNKANLSTCPAVISVDELSNCGVPTMVTKYLVNKDYSNNVSKRTFRAICHGREQCEFSTVYVVNPENIVFRIINTTSNIIYSRIMKRNGKQYVCVDNCGIFNFETVTATRNEDHLVLNLLQTNKKKRDNTTPVKKNQNSRHESKGSLHSNKDAFSINSLINYKQNFKLEESLEQLSITTGPSMCKQLLLKEINSGSND